MNRQTRRGALLGGAAAIVIAGGALYEWPRFTAQKFKGPFGDLVAKLPDAKAAAIVGVAVCNIPPHGCEFSFGNATAEQVDHERRLLSSAPLPDLLLQDAESGRIAEAQGWVLPVTLAILCAMAARTV